ncbi:ArsR/SmtB family transcription factor [Nocardia sp. NPDC059239]|uniref:ArsR/SmtB family transcription factor n=1 Tax=unclassified Nocardia TaxID=2637762 RepID=UPI003689A3E7
MPDTEALPAVAPLPAVLGALQDPIRLEIVRRLANAGTPLRCSLTYDGISKSTAAHHFKILREAGVTARVTLDGNTHLRLRSTDLDTALPGLLAAVLAAANRERDDTPADADIPAGAGRRFVTREQFVAASGDAPTVDLAAFRADQDSASDHAGPGHH